MAKIIVPRNVEELLTLANKIYEKHLSDGAASPLAHLEDYNFDVIGPNIKNALAKHNEAEGYARNADKVYQERDLLMVDIKLVVKASRDVLRGKYSKALKKLGDWGFDVTDTLPGAKPKNGSNGSAGV